MNQVVNQHYVPQSYLKNFSYNNSQVFVFDKFKQRIFPSNVRNIASERFFYDLPQKNIKNHNNTQIIENFFSRLEARQKRFLKHILKKVNGVSSVEIIQKDKSYSIEAITADQKQDLAYITAIQFLRTKEFREYLAEIYSVLLSLSKPTWEQMIIEQINRLELLNFIDFNKEYILKLKRSILDILGSDISAVSGKKLVLLHAKYIIDNCSKIAQILSDHIMIIGINNTDQFLLTSDHPVVRHSYSLTSGLASEGVEIAFPLNDKVILIMKDRKYFHRIVEQDKKVKLLTLEDIKLYNTLQVNNSNRFLFCPVNSFDLVEAICKANPETCSKDKPRIKFESNIII